MRLLLVAAALACASGIAVAQIEAPADPAKSAAKPTPARVDDSRSRALLNEAQTAFTRGDYPTAEDVGLRLLQENIRTFGPDHPNVATALGLIGGVHLKQGRFNEAEGEFRRMLTIYEKRLGPDHEYTAAALNSLALVLEQLGDYPGAESLLRRAVAILDKKLGPNHPDTATTLSNLSRVLDSQGKFAGATDPKTAQLAARADQAVNRGQYQEAETLHYQVLAIHEKTLGLNNATTATSMSNLGRVLDLQGKYAEAERMYRQSLAIRERVLGSEHPDVATNLNNLAKVIQDLGKDSRIGVSEARARARAGAAVGGLTEAENMYRRALAIQDRALGRDHPATALTLNNLGGLLATRGDFAQAEQMERAALATMEKVFGEQHPDTAAVLTSLALALDSQGKVVEAEVVYKRAIDSSRRSGNPRALLINDANLGYALAKRGRYREALGYYKEAVETVDFLYSQTRGYSEETRAAFLQQFSAIYRETIRVLLQLYRQHPASGYDREALAIASRNQSRVFTELMRQADVARFQGEPAFVRLRERRDQLQESLAQLRNLRATVPVTQANAAQRVAEFDAQITQASIDLIGVEEQMWREYPRYMELTNPRPVTVQDLQEKLLNPGETLVSYVLLPNEAIIFVVTPVRFVMRVVPVKRASIAERVHSIRRAVEKVAIGESVLFLREVEPDTLHSLYQDLLAPVQDMLAGREKLLVVADGPLQTIPFELLVARYGTEERAKFQRTKDEADGSAQHPYLGEYAGLDYAARHYRFAYLPSLSALTSQRLYPKPSTRGQLDLVAFADPMFAPDAQHPMPSDTRKALAALNVGGFRRTAGATPVIPRLAETAEEAKEIARVLGGKSRLYIGEAAQESVAKSADLRSARFVLFATHGFLGGQYLDSDLPEDGALAPRESSRAQAQPALALTLVGDLKGEDGLLTMKEVIEDLELNADLVALSACNTAGETAQANNGEGFAGLTRAFMYAGAKGLLVSHWSVDSFSTQALMTTTFRNIKAGMGTLPAVSDARQQVAAGGYTRDNFHFSRAHPFFWAAFVYVGD